MPINNDYGVYKNLKGKESTIVEFNKRIKEIAEKNGLTYIDLWQFLADKNGKLNRRYTNDGLHLTGPGYKSWTNGIKQYLDE